MVNLTFLKSKYIQCMYMYVTLKTNLASCKICTCKVRHLSHQTLINVPVHFIEKFCFHLCDFFHHQVIQIGDSFFFIFRTFLYFGEESLQKEDGVSGWVLQLSYSLKQILIAVLQRLIAVLQVRPCKNIMYCTSTLFLVCQQV